MMPRVAMLDRIVALLAEKPRATKQLASVLGMHEDSAHKLVKILRMQNRIHVARKDRYTNIYGAGPQIEPTSAPERILAHLKAHGAMPARDIAAALGMTPTWAQQVIADSLHGSGVYISSWISEPRWRLPVYAAGFRQDKERPASLTNAEICRRWRANVNKDPERHLKQLAKWRAAKIKPARDPMVAALFGGNTHKEAA